MYLVFVEGSFVKLSVLIVLRRTDRYPLQGRVVTGGGTVITSLCSVQGSFYLFRNPKLNQKGQLIDLVFYRPLKSLFSRKQKRERGDPCSWDESGPLKPNSEWSRGSSQNRCSCLVQTNTYNVVQSPRSDLLREIDVGERQLGFFRKKGERKGVLRVGF